MEGLSYSCGPATSPLRYQTVGQALRAASATWPNHEALVMRHQNVRWTWSELSERVDRLATGLMSLGLSRGDRVAMWGPNSAEWVLTFLACARAGLMLVTLNPAYRPLELLYALRLSGCSALVLADSFKTSDYVTMLLEIAPELDAGEPGVSCEQLPDLKYIIGLGRTTSGMVPFEEVASGVPTAMVELERVAEHLSPDDAICIQFTSGTTGAAKGATLTHFGLLNNGRLTLEVMGAQAGDRICIPVPLFHCFGLVVGLLGCLTHGATMVFPGEGFDPAEVLQAVTEERCTALYGVPTMFIAELAHPSFPSSDLSSLRTGIMGGAPCPEDVMRRVMHDMHMASVTIAFGMTETSPVSFQTHVESDIETRVSTIGTVHPWVEARVAGPNDRPVPIGSVGELHIRGYGVMRGYWGDPDKTAETVDAAGWLRTGDLATMDEQGRCRIVGRSKDMIIRGGENIYPVEVENFLRTHDDIIDVAVFGVPDDRMGEEACAWVKASRPISLADLRAFCAGRLAHYKIPRYLRLVETFPLTASGKMHKPTMREMEAAHAAERPLRLEA
ncbi:AMP-binding protein [Sphingobium sp.]|uniref:AMP-binding protein n=1 Tax=Sphingobium sp. TaxID=1912891 RepID=UPI0028BD5F2E|nr:AMP-binding protein [Sphingobium sp.]